MAAGSRSLSCLKPVFASFTRLLPRPTPQPAGSLPNLAAIDPAAINPAAIDPAAIDPAAMNSAAVNPATLPSTLLGGRVLRQGQQRGAVGVVDTLSCMVQVSRPFSNRPESAVYGGPRPQSPMQRVTLRHLARKHETGVPITMVTAYDYPSAVHVDTAGIDICLVGDSVAMVVHGHDTTLPVTVDDMLLHCRAVARGASRCLLVGDLPFGSYEQSPGQAVSTAVRMLKEGGMDAVKIEGGIAARVAAARAISSAGIAVMGHVGLTPQAISSLGGFRPQGRTAEGALRVVEHARKLQDAGCFAIVLECLPGPVAAAITRMLRIPTIGIGAGPHCSGQVLVYHDLLGMMQHPHHAKVTPKFCKQYGRVGAVIQEALGEYKSEVEGWLFPSQQFSPYKIEEEELRLFEEGLQERGLVSEGDAAVQVLGKGGSDS